jgi:hypothetical protein
VPGEQQLVDWLGQWMGAGLRKNQRLASFNDVDRRQVAGQRNDQAGDAGLIRVGRVVGGHDQGGPLRVEQGDARVTHTKDLHDLAGRGQ